MGGDPQRALGLYEWNTQLSVALMHDLAHVEVGLRNAYDAALSRTWPGPPHWTRAGQVIFAPLRASKRRGWIDINAKSREQLQEAIRKAGGPAAPPGKVIAELPFGFWRYLTAAAYEKTLWVPSLHRAFPAGTNRPDVDVLVRELNNLRNRVAHHEPLLTTNVPAAHARLLGLAQLIQPELAAHVTATTNVHLVLAARP